MNCDPLARWYRWLEYAGFGRALERRRTAFLPRLADARRALVLGDGDGRFLAEFVRRNPHVCIDAVDASARMIDLARHRVRRAGAEQRVNFHCADARQWSWEPGNYDLIVTHFFLDCFTDAELALLLPRIAAASSASAHWVVSEFRQPEAGPIRWVGAVLLAGLYAFFRWTTGLQARRLPHYRRLIAAQDFRQIRAQTALGGLLVSELWERKPVDPKLEEPSQDPRTEQNGVGQNAQRGF